MQTVRSIPPLLALIASCAFLHTSEGAQPSAREIQEGLKTRGFYFGEINGALDEQTKAAIKRLQIREGLKVTGEADAATLAALRKGAVSTDRHETASGVNAELKRLPARERAQKVVQSDREFLSIVEASEESRLPASGSAPGAKPAATPSARPELRETAKGSRQRAAVATREQLPPVAEQPAREQTAPHANGRREEMRPAAAEPSIARPLPREDGGFQATATISEAEARTFVQRYLEAAESPTPAAEIAFFGETVNYFDSGRVTRSFIEKDQRNYYRRWPRRNFELVANPQIERIAGNDATVRFRIRYSLGGGRDRATGTTENIVHLRKAGSDIKIVAIRERKLE